MSGLTEKALEKDFLNYVKSLNGLCIKMHPLVLGGIPDRLILINGFAFFIEFKSPEGRMSKLQEWWFDKLKSLKFTVLIIKDSKTLKNAQIYTYELSRVDNKHHTDA